jgi:hypothetical protein
MKIKYVGLAGVRVIEPYRWEKENGYIQDVTDEAILMNLLTYPRPDFEVVEEPQNGEELDYAIRERSGVDSAGDQPEREIGDGTNGRSDSNAREQVFERRAHHAASQKRQRG